MTSTAKNLRLAAVVVASFAAMAIATSPSASAEPTGVVWPGGGRMLAGSMVLGGSIVGGGSLEVVDGTITGKAAPFDDAPSVLSLRTFTFVPDRDGGGYSAVLRYRVPIVQLHQWRDHAVRMTQTIVLRPSTGQAQAVQIQPDGTTAVGTFGDDRAFVPTGSSDGRVVGNVAVIHVPASLGVTPDWTVQAIAEVTSGDGPFHRNRPATGYLAGTSVVPVGWLTGEQTTAAVGEITNALSTLTSSPAADTPEVPDGVRVTNVRVEGSGTDQSLVVTTQASPLDVPAEQIGHLDVSLAPARFASLDHPATIRWTNVGAESDVPVSIDGLDLGTVHVTVSGTETRFAIGKFTPIASVTIPPGSRFDTLHGSIDVMLAADGDIVSSVDGLSVGPTSMDVITVAFDGPNVTVTRPSTNATATGFVTADGDFVAVSSTEHFIGRIDSYGNAIVHLSRVLPTSAGFRRTTTPSPVVTGADYTTTGLSDFPTPGYEVGMAFLKGNGPIPTLDVDESQIPALELGWLAGQPLAPSTFSATGQPSGAQGGLPDWPLTPVSDVVDATSGFLVSITAGIFGAATPIEQITPWTASNLLKSAAPPHTTTTTPAASPSTTPTDTSADRTTVAETAPLVTASPSDDSSRGTMWIVVFVLLAGAAIVTTVVMTRRRRPSPASPIPAPPVPVLRNVHGDRTIHVSTPVQGWSIGVRASPGPRTTSGRTIDPEDQEP